MDKSTFQSVFRGKLDHHNMEKCNKHFLWLFLGSNQHQPGRVYGLCVYYITGVHKSSTDSGSGDEACTPRDPILIVCGCVPWL